MTPKATQGSVMPDELIGRSALIAVIGAGTMGAGIAQVAAVAGHPVIVYDTVPGAADRAVRAIGERITGLVAKGRLDVDPGRLRLEVARELGELAPAGCVIEAVVEDLAVKQALFAELETIVAPGCVLATNTSSLSPTAIAAGLSHPGRLVGMHFFNPAPVMRLVEVVSGLATSAAVAAAVPGLARGGGKQVVQAAATPGFIVNRVARPYYAEALRLAEEQAATPATIDAVLTRAGGFRMGPFALMDLVGQDVNEAVTRTVWAAFGYDPRFAPSLLQRALVEAGWLGRKSGRGWYHYGDDAPPVLADVAPGCPAPAHVTEHGVSRLRSLLRRSGIDIRPGADDDGAADNGGAAELPSGARLVQCDGRPATALAAAWGVPVVVADRVLDVATADGIAVAASDGCPAAARDEAVGLLQAAGLTVYLIDDVPGLVLTRTVAMLVNGAVDARHKGVASAADIDTAMRLGTNYPLGPLAWGQSWGPAAILAVLDTLHAWYGEDRYRASPLLRRIAVGGGSLV
jgi:3-hydroxybutyryl-CoA dehydrogenase